MCLAHLHFSNGPWLGTELATIRCQAQGPNQYNCLSLLPPAKSHVTKSYKNKNVQINLQIGLASFHQSMVDHL